MKKLTSKSHGELTRRDTIGLRTIVAYDPMAARPTTPVMVGKHVVARRPLLGSVHTLYMVMDGNVIVGTSISYPSEHDCDALLNRHRRAHAAALATSAIDKAKKRKPRALRIREAA